MGAALVTLAPLLFTFTIVTFPGEWLDKYLPSVPFVPTKWPLRAPQGIQPTKPDEDGHGSVRYK